MTTVEQAEKIVLQQVKNIGNETLPFEKTLNRVLAEDITADRDLPPFNRVTMDGVAVSYQAIEEGINTFYVKATQAAGDVPIGIEDTNFCVEIMTGAALHPSVDTVIRYEDVELRNGLAALTTSAIRRARVFILKALINCRATWWLRPIKK
jgi:molybdopterin molybdotransferase